MLREANARLGAGRRPDAVDRQYAPRGRAGLFFAVTVPTP